MRINAVTIAYRDEAIIAGTINCLKPFVTDHIVVISEKPYFGEYQPPDNTFKIAEDLGCCVTTGDFPLDHFQRNLGNLMAKDCDWILTFDSDEMMCEKDIAKLIDYLHHCPADCVLTTPEIYWKSTDYILVPKPSYQPPIAMRPNVKFSYIRNVKSPCVVYDDVTLHHLSWCDPKDIKQKVLSYAHATDFNGQEWYDKHYKNWTPSNEAVLPDGVYSVIKKPLPEELQKCLYSGT